jgi:hypothetical protein
MTMELKERVTEILNDKITLGMNPPYQSVYIESDIASDEITALIEKEYYPKEFTEWTINGVGYSAVYQNYVIFDTEIDVNTLDEVYSYWLTIKEK